MGNTHVNLFEALGKMSSQRNNYDVTNRIDVTDPANVKAAFRPRH